MKTIFVGGCMRSGTTVLQALLCRGEGTNDLIDEATLLTSLAHMYRWGLETFDDLHHQYFRDQENLRQVASVWIDSMISNLGDIHPDVETLVVKNPASTEYFPEFFELAPEARFVVSVRDPRDTIASMAKAAEKQRAAGMASSVSDAGRDMAKLSDVYARAYAPLVIRQGAAFKRRVKFFKYEDLVTDPAATIAGLSDFTGLTFPDNALDNLWQGASAGHMKDPNYPTFSESYGKPLSAARIGTASEYLTPSEIEEIEGYCGALMHHFDYY